MDHTQETPEFAPLERTRSFDEEPKQPTNIPNVIEHALQKLDTATTTKATATKPTRGELTKDDVKYLFSGAPHFMLEKGRHNHWYPHVLFPWDTSLPIQDLWDREQLRHESFTLSTLHAHLPIPSKCDNKDDSSNSDPSKRQGWQYEEGVKRSTYDLGIFEVPNMLSINGKEPGAIGFRHFLELATADAVRYKRAVPTKGHGDALDPHLLSSMPLTAAFDTLSHLRDPYSLCNHESVVLDRHKLLCEGPAAWKRIGVRDVPVRELVERLELLSNFRLEAIKQLPTDESGHKKIITILDKESPETLHKNLYTKLLFPPPHGWSHHQHEELKGQIEVLTRVLAVKGAWVDMSLPEWRLRVGQILWEKPPHTDGDCMDCLKDENAKSEETKKGKTPLSLNTGIERKWLLIQLLLAGELLMRLDAIVQLAVLQQSKTISVTAQDMRELDKLRHGKVNWDILFFQRASDNLIFKFTPPKTTPAASLSEQSQQKIETLAQNETKRSLRSRFGSISQHFPLRHANSTRAGQENTSHESYACESIWETVVVLPRRPERQLKGLAVFAEKIGWPGHETLEARIRSNLLQHNSKTTQALTSESVSPAYSVPVKSQSASRILPKKEAYCGSPSHQYLVLHKSDSTATNGLAKDTGGWLSRSWLAGLVMPGESIHQLLMATALENDPTALQTLGPVANLYGGLSYGDEYTWWSTKCIVGRVLAALPGSKVCMGWVRVNTIPETIKDEEVVNLNNTWISVEGVQEPLQKNTRIRQGIKMASESNPLGKGRVASDTFTIPVDEEDSEHGSKFDVKFDKLILSPQAMPVGCCGSETIKSIFTADRASISFQVVTTDSSAITFQLKYNVAFISSYTCQPPRGLVTHHTPQHDDNSEIHEHDEQPHHTHLPGHPLHKSYKYKYVPLQDLRSDIVPPIIVFPPSKESSPSSSDTHLATSHNEKLTHDNAHKQDEKESGDETLEPVWILDARSSTRDKEVFARAWCAANPPIPQHVSALLSHLTSRPGVQSTLILSRKDGSIIQSTGLLAATSPSSLGTSNTTNTDNNLGNSSPSRAAVTNSSATDLSSPTLPPPESTVSGQPSTNSTQSNQQPYKPSQAETLAAHIFAFMTSASGLALSLSGPGSITANDDIGYDSRSKAINGTLDNGTSTPDDTTTDRTHEREEDDEIKLLRLRTKKNEIVVVPDRKYLLCVVHDASGAGATSSSGGGTSR
ncbi:Hypothetical protein PENO1_048250 [Penicillium occitanis (nom. inval.)]|nr:hypothetical protein PENOC_076690 [Penicillium occitanis (nom. inval.)]PCH00411.1 Hypothetical protein PENO1_048250 [Penicillium occitanis (nom. inval.)]